ncbi:hypothetical protein FG386_000934 [Cryptosporidium ryanae]|uniref:uncharacterized protein n=1 Tax=Cryptosporidium ryanae TaxID=515981 RepID=UPI00351A4518|nr:hypothetical protein FG386_000934 [Cryptosporidium ryanae]
MKNNINFVCNDFEYGKINHKMENHNDSGYIDGELFDNDHKKTAVSFGDNKDVDFCDFIDDKFDNINDSRELFKEGNDNTFDINKKGGLSSNNNFEKDSGNFTNVNNNVKRTYHSDNKDDNDNINSNNHINSNNIEFNNNDNEFTPNNKLYNQAVYRYDDELKTEKEENSNNNINININDISVNSYTHDSSQNKCNLTDDSFYVETYGSNIANYSVNNSVNDLTHLNTNINSKNTTNSSKIENHENVYLNKLIEREKVFEELNKITSRLNTTIAENYTFHTNHIKSLSNRVNNIEVKLGELITLLQSRIKISCNNGSNLNNECDQSNHNMRGSNKLFSNNISNNSNMFSNFNNDNNSNNNNNTSGNSNILNHTNVQRPSNYSKIDDINAFRENQREIEKRAEAERLKKLEFERKKREDAERLRIEQEKKRQIEELERKKKLDMKRKELMSSLFLNNNSGDKNSSNEKKPSLFGEEQTSSNMRSSIFDD